MPNLNIRNSTLLVLKIKISGCMLYSDRNNFSIANYVYQFVSNSLDVVGDNTLQLVDGTKLSARSGW